MIITCPNCSTRYSLPQDKIKPGGQKVRCAKCGTVWHQEPDDEPLALTPEEQVPAPPTPAWAPVTPAEPAPAAMPPAAAPAEPIAPQPIVSEPVAPAGAEAALRIDAPVQPDSFARFHVPAAGEDKPGKGRAVAIAVVIVVALALGALVMFKQQVQDLTGIQLMSSPEAALPAEQAPAAAPPPAAAPKPQAPEPLTLSFDEVESSIEEIDGVRRLMVKGLIVNPADHEQVVPQLAFNMMDKDGKAIDRWTFAAPVHALAPRTTTRFSSQRDNPPTTLQELVPGFDVPENPPPVIEAPTAAAPAAAPAAGATAKPAAKPAAAAPAPKPAASRPPASQQTPAPIE